MTRAVLPAAIAEGITEPRGAAAEGYYRRAGAAVVPSSRKGSTARPAVGLGLHLGDCLQGMLSLGDRSIDAVITDPPYSETVERQARSLKQRGTRELNTGRVKRYDFKFSFLSPELRAGVAQEIARVCRRWALVFCDVEGLADWINDMQACGMRYVRCGAWVRRNGAPQITGDRPAVGFEAIGIFHAAGARMRWNGRGSRAVWDLPIVHSSAKVREDHTTPKPLPLITDLVRLFTDPGETICDPFAGSGTTGVAAIQQGRKFVGWESDPKPYRAAARRIAGAREQLDLFARTPRRVRPKQQPLALGGTK